MTNREPHILKYTEHVREQTVGQFVPAQGLSLRDIRTSNGTPYFPRKSEIQTLNRMKFKNFFRSVNFKKSWYTCLLQKVSNRNSEFFEFSE